MVQTFARAFLGLLNGVVEHALADQKEQGLRSTPHGALWTQGANSPVFATGSGSNVGVSGAFAPLVATWAPGKTWVLGQVVYVPNAFKPSDVPGSPTGAFAICIAAGAGATSGNAPTIPVTAGAPSPPGSAAIVDGAASWAWHTDYYRNGVVLTNTDATNVLYFGTLAGTLTTGGAVGASYIPASTLGLGRSLPIADPRQLFICTAGAFAFELYG